VARDIVQNLKFRKAKVSFDPAAFSAFLEQQYLKSNRFGTRTKQTFAPSSIGGYNGICPRYWYLAFNEHEFTDNNDALGIANMANGTAAHDRIEKLLVESGMPVDIEVEMKMVDPPIRGYIDMMLEVEGEVVIGEFKTTRQEVFMIRQASMKPSAQHLIQILIYLKATQKKSGFLLYENKNTQEFLVIPVHLDEKNEAIIEEVFEWLRMVYKNFEEGELPKRPFTKRNKTCKSCPIFDWCWNKQPEGTIDIPVMEVPKI
jgi:CRISPR/Cas system-associated exonuclease Cas4 (RecB family)